MSARKSAPLAATSSEEAMSELPQDRNVDQIRDILFGGQMRDYERRFKELTHRLDQDLQRLGEHLDTRVAQVERKLDEHVERLGRQLRQESAERSKSVEELETRVQSVQRSLRGELQTSVETLEADLKAREERLRVVIADLSSHLSSRLGELRDLLARTDQDLRDDKVGRTDLAGLLQEVALRLKGEMRLSDLVE